MPVNYFWQPLICTFSDPAEKITKPIQKVFFLQDNLRRNTFRERKLAAVITSDASCDNMLYVSCSVFSLLTAGNEHGIKSPCLKEITICTFYCKFPWKVDICCVYNKHYINRFWKHASLILLLEHSVIIITNIYTFQKYNSSLWMYDKIAVSRKPVNKYYSLTV